MAEYNRKDRFYTKAKEEGFRSRAAYKLLELNKKYNFLKKSSVVLDLGCFPGGWCQVAAHTSGKVVGVDLRPVDAFEEKNVFIVQGDATEPEVQAELERLAGRKFDIVLSDMSPHLSGIAARDNAQIAELVELAFQIATKMLRSGGFVVIKAFPNNDIETVLQQQKRIFKKLKRIRLESTRTTSNEFYVMAELP